MCHPISILKTQNERCIESPDTIKVNKFFLSIARLPPETSHCYVVFPAKTKAILCLSSGQKLTFKTKPVICPLEGLDNAVKVDRGRTQNWATQSQILFGQIKDLQIQSCILYILYNYRLLMRSTHDHEDRVRYWLTDAVVRPPYPKRVVKGTVSESPYKKVGPVSV